MNHWRGYWHDRHWYDKHWYDRHWYSVQVPVDTLPVVLAVHRTLDASLAMNETQEFTLERHMLAESLEIHPADCSAIAVSVTRELAVELTMYTEKSFTVEC